MKKHLSKYLILLLLAVLFAAPGITAYFVYQHPQWLSSSKVNHGTLMTPPVPLSLFDKSTKWRMVYWNHGACAKPCLEQLDKLARIRLALGRKLYLVDQWLIVDNLQDLSESVKKFLKERDFHLAQLVTADASKIQSLNKKIFIANPDNYLVLSYPASVQPDDIYKDLKLLLSTNETKSG